MLKKYLGVLALIATAAMFTGCLNDNSKENIMVKNETGTIENSNNFVEVKAQSDFKGGEFIVNKIINEGDIVANSGLLKIVMKDGNTTKIVLAATNEGIKSGEKILTIKNCHEKIEMIPYQKSENGIVTKRTVGDKLLGDLNNDGVVGAADFQEFAQNYIKPYNAKYDIAPAVKGTGVWADIYCKATPDGVLSLVDFTTFAQNYGKTKPIETVVTIPENMTLVEGGTFTMGNNFGIVLPNLESTEFEKPIHQVTLNSFYIGKYEVTQNEWSSVTGKNPSFFRGYNLPVENVSWNDIVEYCNARSEKEGLTKAYSYTKIGDNNLSNVTLNINANGYRMPTEAEWEFAARGGMKSKGYVCSGSNTPSEVSWYTSNSGTVTHVVGSKKANELGLYDMNGNVSEFCWDWAENYTSNAQVNPTGPVTPNINNYRIMRGGGWFDYDASWSISYRSRFGQTTRGAATGFRLVRRG